jgi:predicted Zn-dependent protease with MMP-like domain
VLEQIVEVDDAAAALGLGVGGAELHDLLGRDPGRAPRPGRLGSVLLERDATGPGPRQLGGDGDHCGAVELGELLQQARRTIEQHRRRASRLCGACPQLGPGDGMERAGPHAIPQTHRPQPRRELGGGGPREGERQQSPGIVGAGRAPPGDAAGEDAGLAGSGAGEDAEGQRRRGDRLPLGIVEPGQQLVRVGTHDDAPYAPALMVEVSAERFEELVADALDAIPDGLAKHMDNVAVFIQDRSRQRGLLGLYQGVPLTRRDSGYTGMVLPDRITIYRQAILARCRSEEEVVHQVAVTVVHEVAHHFGIGDRRLAEVGWA